MGYQDHLDDEEYLLNRSPGYISRPEFNRTLRTLLEQIQELTKTVRAIADKLGVS